MGKNFTFYIYDDLVETLHDLEGKGTLINELLRNHLDESLEALQKKLASIDFQRNQILAKITKKREEILHKETRERELKNRDENKIKRDKIIDKLKQLWQNNTIEDECYWGCFDKEGIIIEKAQEVISDYESKA